MPPLAWKAPSGLTKAQRAAEQDVAAGDELARLIAFSDGRVARASVALRGLRQGRRVYAYLRWSVSGKTSERYVCEVDRMDRRSNLEQAWEVVHNTGMLSAIGRGSTSEDPAHERVMGE